MAIDPQALYVQLGRLVEAMPDLYAQLPLPASTQEWLGRVAALIAASGDIIDIAEFNTYSTSLSKGTLQFHAAQDLGVIVRRALAKAELNAPAAVQGSFIAAGNAFDAMAAVGKVLIQAGREVLIVDPYLDEKALTDFAVLARLHVQIRLLADEEGAKPSLRPAAERWASLIWTKPTFDGEVDGVQSAPRSTNSDRRSRGVCPYTITQRIRLSVASFDRAS
jgi:hypothetical protein